MQLGQLVVGEVEAGEAGVLHVVDQLLLVGRATGLHPYKNVSNPGIGQPVAELAEAALAQHATEAPQATGLLGDLHRQHRFAVFADLSALGHEAQPVEVHVGAAGNRHQGLAVQALLHHIALHAGYGKGSGRLQDRTGVFEHVLDGCADGVGVDCHHAIHRLLRQFKSELTDAAHRHAIGEKAHLLKLHPLPGG